MHYNNIQWLDSLRARFPEAFTDNDVLEVGSAELGEQVTRTCFHEGTYTGIDPIEGPGVDIVGDVVTHDFGMKRFDTVVMLSVFEHTPDWRLVLHKGIDLTKDNGFIIIGFGPEGNGPHPPDPWAPVGHREFLAEVCKRDDVSVIEAFFEPQMFWPGDIRCFDALLRKGRLRIDGQYEWQGPDPSQNYYPPDSPWPIDRK